MARAKVTVTNLGRVDRNGQPDADLKHDRWEAGCECGWSYSNVVKTDVQQEATRHRKWHRGAADTEGGVR